MLSSLLFWSCSNNHISAQNSTSFTSFAKEEKPTPQKFIDFPSGKVNKIFLKDSLLIVRNTKLTVRDYFFFIYNLRTKKLLDSQFKVGSNANEILSPMSTGIYKNLLWAHDITTKKIVTQPVLKRPDDRSGSKEFGLKSLLYSVQLTDSSRIFANGDYKKTSKIQLIDLPSDQVIKAFGQYDTAPKGIDPAAWRNANESFLFLQPKGEKLVSACRFTDKIEIFNLSTFKSKIISGPENYEPEFNPIKFNGSYIIERNEKTRFAFVNGYVTDKYIYLLYSGNNHMSEHLDYGKTIFVYDWEGNAIKKLNLPAYISCFAISNDKTAYIFDIKDKAIKTIILNL
jgi:hypothetical protein